MVDFNKMLKKEVRKEPKESTPPGPFDIFPNRIYSYMDPVDGLVFNRTPPDGVDAAEYVINNVGKCRVTIELD